MGVCALETAVTSFSLP
uniref:Uncharacterized protein n=1 Tax=Anguilla anguilla TaxID=7936 RepID=A0A0E9RLP2_ANGAN